MRHRLVTASILATTLSAFAIAGAAQRSQQNPQDQTTQDQSKQDQSKPGTTSHGMMGQGMMGQGQDMMSGDMIIGQMKAHHQQITETMNKLMQSMTVIQNEKDSAALKSKLAEHRALLEQMQNQMMQQGSAMQNMMQRMMGGTPPAPQSPPASK